MDITSAVHTLTESANTLFILIGAIMVLARSEEHTSELQSRETISYAVFCLKKKNKNKNKKKKKNNNRTQ